jgi:hypothetical protein
VEDINCLSMLSSQYLSRRATALRLLALDIKFPEINGNTFSENLVNKSIQKKLVKISVQCMCHAVLSANNAIH